MENNELSNRILLKMQDEYDDFLNNLLTLSPEEIIEKLYEKVFKEDILYCIQEKNLENYEINALISLEKPLETIYQNWLDTDVTYMEELDYCIEKETNLVLDKADKVAGKIDNIYLSVFKIEDGYDYKFFDKNYKELDSGVYDEPNISIYAAIKELLTDDDSHSLKRLDNLEEMNFEELETLTELTRKENEFKETPVDSFMIYQIKDGEKFRDYRFNRYSYMEEMGLNISKENYNLVYSGELQNVEAVDETLNALYYDFNHDHPEDFTGHSLSVSDVLVIKLNGQISSHYVDSFGFRKLEDFFEFKSPYLAYHQPITPEQDLTDEQIHTPRGNFALTNLSKKQMEQANYGIHHYSEDNNYLIMSNGTRTFAIENPDRVAKPIHEKSDNILVSGHVGTWYVIDSTTINNNKYFLLEHEEYGDTVPNLIIDKSYKLIAEDIYNGFDDLELNEPQKSKPNDYER